MINTIDIFGKHYTIKVCDENDVLKHFLKIKKFIPKEEHKEFVERMFQCVKHKSAYALLDNSCFLYYLKNNSYCANGVAMYGKNTPIKFIALLSGIFNNIDKEVFKIDFSLHPGKLIEEYKSIVTLDSIKKYRNGGEYITVRVDKIKLKVNTLLEKRGIKWEV